MNEPAVGIVKMHGRFCSFIERKRSKAKPYNILNYEFGIKKIGAVVNTTPLFLFYLIYQTKFTLSPSTVYDASPLISLSIASVNASSISISGN